VRAAEAATKDYDGLHLTIAAAYDGRQEITDAVQSFLREQLKNGKKLDDVIDLVTPDALRRHIYSPDLPDPTSSSAPAARFGCRGFCCAEHHLGILFLRSELARVPQDRFPAGDSFIPGPHAAVWAVRGG